MHKTVKKWLLRLCATTLLILGLLVVIIANPSWLYAHKTKHANFFILHHSPLNMGILVHLEEASLLLKKSELYDSVFSMEICLNDGSGYTRIAGALGGPAFARGFYNKIVLFGLSDYGNNYTLFNGGKWNFAQLITHEAIHCLQFNKYGLWNSKPVDDIPDWKWEGYPEYIARQLGEPDVLKKNIRKLIDVEKISKPTWINFEDGTGSPLLYFKDGLLVSYCIDIKKMSYDQLLSDKRTREFLWEEMMKWYSENGKLNGVNKVISAEH